MLNLPNQPNTKSPMQQQVKTNTIKLCPKGAQACVLPLFCNHDFEINPMILKLESDLDIPKMNLQTENEA